MFSHWSLGLILFFVTSTTTLAFDSPLKVMEDNLTKTIELHLKNTDLTGELSPKELTKKLEEKNEEFIKKLQVLGIVPPDFRLNLVALKRDKIIQYDINGPNKLSTIKVKLPPPLNTEFSYEFKKGIETQEVESIVYLGDGTTRKEITTEKHLKTWPSKIVLKDPTGEQQLNIATLNENGENMTSLEEKIKSKEADLRFLNQRCEALKTELQNQLRALILQRPVEFDEGFATRPK